MSNNVMSKEMTVKRYYFRSYKALWLRIQDCENGRTNASAAVQT